jgi:hypothetical protein
MRPYTVKRTKDGRYFLVNTEGKCSSLARGLSYFFVRNTLIHLDMGHTAYDDNNPLFKETTEVAIFNDYDDLLENYPELLL